MRSMRISVDKVPNDCAVYTYLLLTTHRWYIKNKIINIRTNLILNLILYTLIQEY